MSDLTFKMEQEDANEFSLTVEGDVGLRLALSTQDAVDLWRAVNGCIGDYVREMDSARQLFNATYTGERERGFEGVGDFDGDPVERYLAHRAAKGR